MYMQRISDMGCRTAGAVWLLKMIDRPAAGGSCIRPWENNTRYRNEK